MMEGEGYLKNNSKAPHIRPLPHDPQAALSLAHETNLAWLNHDGVQ